MDKTGSFFSGTWVQGNWPTQFFQVVKGMALYMWVNVVTGGFSYNFVYTGDAVQTGAPRFTLRDFFEDRIAQSVVFSE